MKTNVSLPEFIITQLVKLSGYSAILFVSLIFFFLIKEGVPTFTEVPLSVLFSQRWYPIEEYFGILPLISGSIIITIGATLIAVPTGVGTAVFISEVAPRWAREILKPLVELLGGLPSVVIGFLGILAFTPAIRVVLNIPTGLTALAGSLLLAIVALPTVVSVAEDALDTVPRSYREGAWALGATRWQTIWRVTLPAAKSGVLTAVMLGIGRAIGETIIVMMVTGNAPVMANKLSSIISPVRTMTATIAAEMGEVANGSVHYHTLFFIGMMLFIISLVVNITASAVVFRSQKRAEKALS